MRTLIAVMLFSTVAAAQELPADAPVNPAVDTEVSLKVKAGQPVPFDARCVTLAENERRGQEHAQMRGELEKAHQAWLMPKPLFVTVVLVAAVVSAGIGAGVTYAALEAGKPKPQP